MFYKETEFGFDWGSAKITHCFSDEKKEGTTLRVVTPKHNIQIYVTKTGKVRIFDEKGEWKKP
jgi:hypothetical protein